MVDQYVQSVAAGDAADVQYVARRVGSRYGERLDMQRLESAPSVEQRDVDSASVGRVAVHDAVVQLGERRLLHHLPQHHPVLNLGQPDDVGQAAACVGCREHDLGDGVALPDESLPGPAVFSVRGEVVVERLPVVEGIEEILDVPEHYGFPAAFLGRASAGKEKGVN